MSITPNADQFLDYAQSDLEGEVVMLNLLKFKERADGEEGSGREAYERYGEAAVKMVHEQGGRLADTVIIACAPAPGFGSG